MAQHPLNDRIKVKVANNSRWGGTKDGVESGVVVEVPDMLIYLSFHSFAFEESLMSGKLKDIQAYYNKLMGKKIAWESLQDRGRRFVEGEDEFVYIQMTDILFYADDTEEDIQLAAKGGFSA